MKIWQDEDNVLAQAQKLFMAKEFEKSLRLYEKAVIILSEKEAEAEESDEDSEEESKLNLVVSEESYVRGKYYLGKQRYYLSHINMTNARMFDDILDNPAFFRFTPDSLTQKDFMRGAWLYGRFALKKYNALPSPISDSDIYSLSREDQKKNLIALLNERDVTELMATKLKASKEKMFMLDCLIWNAYKTDPTLEFAAW
jgi:hypothetical protein